MSTAAMEAMESELSAGRTIKREEIADNPRLAKFTTEELNAAADVLEAEDRAIVGRETTGDPALAAYGFSFLTR
jgi:hypothetical protein